MLVEVRPLPEKKWHGKTGKESFAQSKIIEVLYNRETGKYNTGLTPQEAEEYGKKLGVDLSDTFHPEQAHPYWSSKPAGIELENNTKLFNTDRPVEYVKVKNMKASKFVANSVKEWEDGLWPDATHVIFDEEEEVVQKASKIALADKATIMASKMSAEDKINMVQILSKKSIRGRSTDFINVEIADVIKEKAAEFIRFADMGKEDVYVRAAVLECIGRDILTKEGSVVFYMGEQIGFDTEEAIQWFKNPQNQKMKVAILEQLNKFK